eukprot:GHVU01095280.1.p1 GENE.GHVU01095280.1~~GHVU01095280.1.p1  ORF type:complete len:123 (+),score=2.99 GHVU01095280.1:199-567(+)
MNISLGQVTVYSFIPNDVQVYKHPMLIALSVTIIGVLSIGLMALLYYTIRRSRKMEARNRTSVVSIEINIYMYKQILFHVLICIRRKVIANGNSIFFPTFLTILIFFLQFVTVCFILLKFKC